MKIRKNYKLFVALVMPVVSLMAQQISAHPDDYKCQGLFENTNTGSSAVLEVDCPPQSGTEPSHVTPFCFCGVEANPPMDLVVQCHIEESVGNFYTENTQGVTDPYNWGVKDEGTEQEACSLVRR